jgi:hypothetical protein
MQEKSKKIYIYKVKHYPPSNQAIGMINTKFETQEGSNQNMRFLNGKIPYSPLKPRQITSSPSNQDKSNQASNSTKLSLKKRTQGFIN